MLLQRLTLLLACLFFLALNINAQELRGVCGNTYADQMSQIDRYMDNKRIAANKSSKRRNAITYIPIQFNVITKNNGSGSIQLTDLLEQICLLNNQYGEFDVIFYMPENPSVIANDVIYDDHTFSSAQFTMRQRRNREALNIWIVNDASPQNGPPVGVTLGYYDTVNDWVIIRKNQISAMNNTLAHEIGHFFSLFHPHLGWDSEPYSIDMHGLQVEDRAPSGGKTELMDRSNCETAGDMICDTPPDYNFALTWNDCPFNVDVKDPNGDQVDPDETLIMSYFKDECTSKFTETQVEMILADIDRPGRNFLNRGNYSPIADEITATPNLIAPIESVVTSAYNKVELRWQPVAGATSYLLEVDRSSSFNIDNYKFFTNQTSFVLEDLLDPDKNYRWRITPYNPSYTCAGPSETARFKTGISTSVATIESVNSWTILPNPVLEAANLTIQVKAATSFSADIKLFSVTGQLLKMEPNIPFSKGAASISINIANLAKGIYFVTLENNQGILNKKLVIQ